MSGIEGIPVIDQLPWSVILLFVVGVGSVLLMRADFGRQLIAVGDNERAARLSGVRVDRVRILAFVLSGTLAAVAGILLAGFGGVSAQAGLGLEFDAITACVLGGVVLGGGRGSVVAAMAGALTLEALFTWLNLQGISGALEDTVQGVIIIAAVGVRRVPAPGRAMTFGDANKRGGTMTWRRLAGPFALLACCGVVRGVRLVGRADGERDKADATATASPAATSNTGENNAGVLRSGGRWTSSSRSGPSRLRARPTSRGCR